MKKIWLLTKIQLGAALDLNVTFTGKKLMKKRGLMFYAGIILLGLILCGASFSYSLAIGTSLNMVGMTELLPELMMAVTCVITLLTTIYKVKGTLFDFKDYDMIMSLPIKTSDIVASRMLLLYCINIIFTVIVLIPAAIAYGILSNPSIVFYVFSFIILWFIPLVPIIIATIIGTIITVVSAKFKHNNIIQLIIVILFFTVVMIASFTTSGSAEQMGQITSVLTQQVDGIYPLAKIYRLAVVDYDFVSMIMFLGISIITFMVFAKVVGLKFKSLNSRISAKHTKSDYKMGSLAQTSPFMALFRKEIKRYFSSTIYVLNTGMGIVMMTIAAVAILFVSKEQLANIMDVPEMADMLGSIMPIVVSMLTAMTYITACSISLEGKNLWILKASPVPVKTIFNSKIAVNLTIILPAVFIDGMLIGFGLRLSWKELIIQFAMPVAYSFFTCAQHGRNLMG